MRAAEQCFAKHGFSRTAIEPGKRAAGVSTGAIYTYFPNKEAMMRAIATEAVNHVVTAQLHAKGTADAFDASTAASLLVAIFLGIEVQTAVGMKLDAGKAAKMLTTVFADFLPNTTQAAHAAKPMRGRRAAAGKRSTRVTRH